MRLSLLFNVIGLAISAAGALLMFYFPPRLLMVTEAGEKALTLVSNSDPASTAIGKRQTRLSRLGPAMLALGLIAQMAAFLPFGEPSFSGASEQVQGRVWVLWATPIKSDSAKPEVNPQWQPVDTFSTEDDCKRISVTMMGKLGERTETRCFPDSVDPRGPKGK
jgi:hypothetical protein